MSKEWRADSRNPERHLDPLGAGVEPWNGSLGPLEDDTFHATLTEDPPAIAPRLTPPEQVAAGARRIGRVSRR
ncbi:MAG: hypothetical protein HYY93_07630 [Planctomycetes bacterium]|nr:hypothetical protein [Planctomycetota bacterium]